MSIRGRGGNRKVTHNTICDSWPMITIISRYSDSVITILLQDKYIMMRHGICLTEEYKMHKYKTFVCPTDVVKAEVG